MNERVLVIASHPDDECLGAGGTMFMHSQDGDEVRVVIVAEGSTSRDTGNSEEVERLKASAIRASELLGCTEDPIFGGFPDNRLDSIDILDLAKFIEGIAREYMPTIVYTHHPNDCNIDHETTGRAVLAAFRPQPNATVHSLRLFEVMSATEWGSRARQGFVPQYFQELSAEAIDAKHEALDAYRSEMRQWPHPRSDDGIMHLMHLRGCTIGRRAAEAFQIEYQIS